MKRLVLILTAGLWLVSLSAQQSQPIPVDPAVRIGQLDNGLTYYIRHNAEPQGQANFYIAQKVGSILEEEEQRGLAHFLEHMCFNGTQHFPGNGVIRYCESIGVKFGYNLNAYTNFDETIYNIDNVPVGAIPSSIDSCLWILHDWADGLLLTDEDIDHERGVIHEEWRTRTNAQIRMIEQILPCIYPKGENHPCPDGSNRYAHRMPIGLMSVVDYFPYKVLRDYYEKWYRPDLQGVIVVGDIDVDAMEAKIRDIFSTIAKPVNPEERYYVQIPDNEAPLICLAKDKEQGQVICDLFLKHDPYPEALRGDINYLVYRYAMLAGIVMLRERLADLSRSANPPFLSATVSTGNFFIARTKHALSGEVISSEEGLTTAVTTLYREMLRAVRNGFTDSEYERIKAQILADAEAAYNSRNKKKSIDFCNQYVQHFLNNEPIPDIETDFAITQQIAGAVNAQMVGQIFGQVIGKNNLVMFAMLPDKEGVTYPTDDELRAALAAVEAEDIAPYAEEVSDQPLMASMPKPGRVRKSEPAAMGYTRYILSNGANVYFRQTDFNPNEVLMTAVSNGGTSLYPLSAELKAFPDLLLLGGLGSMSLTELRKAIAGRKVDVQPTVEPFAEYITSSSTPKDLETMFQLNYLCFTALRSDNEAFESWRSRQRSAIVNRQNDPAAALYDSTCLLLNFHGERLLPLTLDELEGINFERAMRIARERFANAADFAFIITGATDEATLIPLLEQYIASLPAKGKKEKADLKALGISKKGCASTFRRPMDVPMVMNIFFDVADAPFSLKSKLTFSLALNALSVVLMEEIREKEGGTYDIGAYGDFVPNPAPRYQAIMQIPYRTAPDRYEYLNRRVREIVAQFVAEGPSEENMAKGKEFILKNYNENLRENVYWANEFRSWLDTKVDLTKDFEAVLNSITADDCRRSIDDLLKQKAHSEIIMIGEPRR
ncbi:MAG: insulinase family protein [Paludibacteraceae bacterium]|nr:insulinase family protein [Paludibacteraceae bacterium]